MFSSQRIFGYDTRTKEVDGLRFCMMSPEEILKKSVVEIDKAATYIDGVPVNGGLFDPKMGAVNSKADCVTCGQNYSLCPNHFGHIELVHPLFAPPFMNYARNLMKMVCFHCSKIVVNIDTSYINRLSSPDAPSSSKFNTVLKLVNKRLMSTSVKIAKECDHCHKPLPTVKNMSDPYQINMVIDGEVTTVFADTVLDIFKRIPDGDMFLMGFDPEVNRPEWTIWTRVLVPPPSVRPSVKFGISQRGENDLTTQLNTIIKANLKLKEELVKKNDIHIRSAIRLLQWYVIAFVDNTQTNIPQVKQRSGKVLQTLFERIKGKSGRVRNNLLGKRVNHSARTVASSDPGISIDEVGIPYKIATTITFPETVTTFNIEKLKGLTSNGPYKYPGAKYVLRVGSGKTFAITEDFNSESLEYGDVVYRHVLDDDIVIVNRQPTLHRMSMMAHRAKIMPYNTVRISVCTTPAYAGDFDGDENNFHVCQSIQTQVEAQLLASPSSQIISPRESAPIISIIQDHPIALYLMTHPDTRIETRKLCNYSACIDNLDMDRLTKMVQSNTTYLTGIELFSLLMPTGFSLKGSNFEIEDGMLVSGRINKSSYQNTSIGILHAMVTEYGYDVARKTLDSTQRVCMAWMMDYGYSVGLADLWITESMKKKLSDRREELFMKSLQISRDIHTTNMSNAKNGRVPRVMLEESFSDQLKDVDAITNDILDNMTSGKDNRFMALVKSKAKGKVMNIFNMVGIIGQQLVDDERIKNNYDSRTMPHFTKFDHSAKARGFVYSSYLDGLDPVEYYFHAMKGRIGLLNTNVRTAAAGYLQRKLTKTLEDIYLNNNLCAVDKNDNVIQFVYGHDGADYTRQERQEIPQCSMSRDEFVAAYDITWDKLKSVYANTSVSEATVMTTEAKKRYKSHLDKLLAYRRHISVDVMQRHIFGKHITVWSPVHVGKILDNLTRTSSGESPPATPAEAIAVVEKLVESMYITEVHGKKEGNDLIRAVMSILLNPVELIVVRRLSSKDLTTLFETIIHRYLASVAYPGENVAIVSAQSIGEYLMQSTLDSFKSVAAGGATLTLKGTPRVQEIVSFTKNPKMVSMTIPMKNDEDIHRAANHFKLLRISDIVLNHSIVYTSWSTLAQTTDMNKTLIDVMATSDEGAEMRETQNPFWFIKLELDPRMVATDAVTMSKVHGIIVATLDSANVQVYHTPLNPTGKNYMVIVPAAAYVNKVVGGDNMDIYASMVVVKDLVMKIQVNGVKGISYVEVQETKLTMYNPVTEVYEENRQKFLSTSGSNFLDIISDDYVDSTQVYSNNLHDIIQFLGVEAAREAIVYELMDAIGASTGDELSEKHTSMVADYATVTGSFISFDRSGFSKSSSISPLTKVSFEESTQQITKAAIFGEFDAMKSVAGSLMLGQDIKTGTTYNSILVDVDKLAYINTVSTAFTESVKTFTDDLVTSMVDIQQCSKLVDHLKTLGVARHSIGVVHSWDDTISIYN
ncbi:MAG: hypothetical protein KAG66_08755 [Methylococcales bacterium]|nr:hypothetical protein [Methylococcales bacterium]